MDKAFKLHVLVALEAQEANITGACQTIGKRTCYSAEMGVC